MPRSFQVARNAGAGVVLWSVVVSETDTKAKNTVFTIFRALADLDVVSLGAHQEPGVLPFLRFTPEAQTVFNAWRAKMERRLRTTDDSHVITSHLAKYRSLIEGWYNPRRRHSALDYLSPMIYERTSGIGDRTVTSGSTIDQGGAISVSPSGAVQ